MSAGRRAPRSGCLCELRAGDLPGDAPELHSYVMILPVVDEAVALMLARYSTGS
jgi:hypothetical protein